MAIKNSFLAAAAFALSLAGLGCQRGPSQVHLHGTATWAGQPIAHGEITLNPLDDTDGPQIGGVIREGKYDLLPPSGPRAGGAYRVEIMGWRKSGRMLEKPYGDRSPPIELMENYVPDQFNVESLLVLRLPDDARVVAHDFALSPAAPESDRKE